MTKLLYVTQFGTKVRLKLLRTVPDHNMVSFIMETVSNHHLTLRTSDGQYSQPRKLKNGVSQRSILAPFLFNIYISNVPPTQSRLFIYADDLAVAFSSPSLKTVENNGSAMFSEIVGAFSNVPAGLTHKIAGHLAI